MTRFFDSDFEFDSLQYCFLTLLVSLFEIIQALSINILTLLLGLGLFTNDHSGEDAQSSSEGLGTFITVCILFSNAMFLMSVAYTLVKYSELCAACKNKNRGVKKTAISLAVVVVPTSSSGSDSGGDSDSGNDENGNGSSSEKQKEEEQLSRKKILDKIVKSDNTRKLSTSGLAFVNKVVTSDQAHRTQLRHTQSKARVDKQMDKKKKIASQKLNNRLLSRQRSKKIKKKDAQATSIAATAPTEQVQQNKQTSAEKTVSKNKQTIVVVPGVPKNDNGYQKNRENAAKRILYLKLKKKEKVIVWFQMLPPKNESNVIHQKSLAMVLQKLKVPNMVSERLAKEMINTKGMNSSITLEQFWGWADTQTQG